MGVSQALLSLAPVSGVCSLPLRISYQVAGTSNGGAEMRGREAGTGVSAGILL